MSGSRDSDRMQPDGESTVVDDAPRRPDDADEAGEAELGARLALARVAEPGDARMGRWLEQHGAVEVLTRLRAGHAPRGGDPGEAERYAARMSGLDVDAAVEADLEAAARLGARLVVPGTTAWPTQLDDLGPARPLLLWARGPADLRLQALCSVALVGARAATSYGVRVGRELAAGLASRRWTVVSGGAYGIDSAAHVGALSAGGVTFAVLATGVDEVYPKGNDALLARVLDTGLLLSELPPGSRPWRSRFLERNRVIAALSRGTVVVEAAARSGAMSTAWRAVDLNRPLMGVPGPVTSAMSAGVHARLRAGEAVLVTSVDDVLEMLTPLGSVPSDDARPDATQQQPLDGLARDAFAVHEALSASRPRPVRELAREAGVTARVAIASLGELGVKGLAVRVDGGWCAVRPDAR